MVAIAVVVDVWTAGPTTAPTAADVAALDAVERARAASLPRGAADRFVLARVLLRTAVAARSGCAPGEVTLHARCATCGGPHGRVVVGPSSGAADRGPVHVSVTRAGPVVAVALCTGGPVGIDVESAAAVAAAPLVDVALSPRELADHRHHRPGRRAAAARSLARTWVRKEAALKALGTGLTVDPSSVELARPPAGARGVDAVVGDCVAVTDLPLRRGTVGAVAVLAPGLVHPGAGRTGDLPQRLVVRRYDAAPALGRRRA